MNLPTPRPEGITKPNDNGFLAGAGSIIGDIFDASKNVFSKVADIELFKWETERLADARAAERAGKEAQQQTYAGTPTTTSSTGFAMPNQQVLMLGALALGAVVLLRK